MSANRILYLELSAVQHIFLLAAERENTDEQSLEISNETKTIKTVAKLKTLSALSSPPVSVRLSTSVYKLPGIYSSFQAEFGY